MIDEEGRESEVKLFANRLFLVALSFFLPPRSVNTAKERATRPKRGQNGVDAREEKGPNDRLTERTRNNGAEWCCSCQVQDWLGSKMLPTGGMGDEKNHFAQRTFQGCPGGHGFRLHGSTPR